MQRTVNIGGFAPKLRILYVPRGPLLNWGNKSLRKKVLDDLQLMAREQGAIFIKMDPEAILGKGIPGSPEAEEYEEGITIQHDLKDRGWHYSQDQIQFKNTVWVDLSPSEEDLLSAMKQKTRYNIRLASKKGVKIRTGSVDDLKMLYRMYAATSVRDGFVIRSEDYYLKVWETFIENQMAEPLIAEVEGEPVAGIFLFHFAGMAWYLHGMSTEKHRKLMPNYLLQWEAIKRSKNLGCKYYDLWGAPEQFNEMDSMWGVFRFKDGLGGEVIRSLGAWDYPNKPLMYTLYTKLLPKLLAVLRRRGKTQTRQEISI